jgi:hypothetical protein
MVEENIKRTSGSNVGKREIEDSLFSMLEKSGMGTEYRPIILESLLSVFKLELNKLESKENGVILAADGTSFDTSTGTLRVSRKRVLRGIVRVAFFMVALIATATYSRGKRKYVNTAILFGIEERFLNTQEAIVGLSEYLRKKFPDLLKDVDQILFQSRNNAFFSILSWGGSTFPIIALRILRDNFTFKSRWRIILSVSKLVREMVQSNWNIFFIAPERIFLEFPIWQMMLTNMNFKLVATQSNLELLPTSFYLQNSNRSMVWYSNNSLPFNKIGCRPIEPEIALNSSFIDHHYVWSESHKEFLAHRYPNSEITTVGPITFEASKLDVLLQREPEGILYFDVTPFDNLEYETFYTSKMCSEAIRDLTEVAEKLSVRLHLKPKRPYLLGQGAKIQHSESYVKLLYKLEGQKLVTLLDPYMEITDAVMSSQVVVGLPFTSPVLVSSQFKRPSIYYLPLDSGNWDIQPERDGIAVIQGKDQLLEYLSSLLVE